LTNGCGQLLLPHTFEPMKLETAHLNRMPEHPAMLVFAGWLPNVAIERIQGGGRSKP